MLVYMKWLGKVCRIRWFLRLKGSEREGHVRYLGDVQRPWGRGVPSNLQVQWGGQFDWNTVCEESGRRWARRYSWARYIALCMCCSQFCPTLCNPLGCSLPRSSAHEIFHARILGWVAISYSKGYSWPRDHTRVSCFPALAGRFFTTTAPQGKPVLPYRPL